MTGYEIQLQTDSIVRAIAGGAKRADVCTAFDLTPSALAAIESEQAGAIEQTRQRLQLATRLNEQFLTQLAPQAARNIEHLLNDPNHKEHYPISWKVLEHALPKTLSLDGNVGLAMSESTAVALTEAFTKLMDNRAEQPKVISVTQDPNLLDQRQ